jgi:hypothetical protein
VGWWGTTWASRGTEAHRRDGGDRYDRVVEQGVLVHNPSTVRVQEEIGAFHTGNANWLLIQTGGTAANNWLQPFFATPAGIKMLEGFLLAAGLGTGAAIVEVSVVLDLRGTTIPAVGGTDPNGGFRVIEAIPAFKIIAHGDDPGEPTRVALALDAVKRYLGVP